MAVQIDECERRKLKSGIESILGMDKHYYWEHSEADDIIETVRKADSTDTTTETLSQLTYKVEYPDLYQKREIHAGEKRTKKITRKKATLILLLFTTGKVYKTVPKKIQHLIKLYGKVDLNSVQNRMDVAPFIYIPCNKYE